MQVGISVLRLLLFVGRPKIYVMGNFQNTEIYRNIEQYPQATTLSSIIILHIDGPIYFANSSYLRDRFIIIYFIIIYQILAINSYVNHIYKWCVYVQCFARIGRWIDEEEEKLRKSEENSLQYIILDLSG